jgi:hypothetical protein
MKTATSLLAVEVAVALNLASQDWAHKPRSLD